jgi:probable rRNA maturation factor
MRFHESLFDVENTTDVPVDEALAVATLRQACSLHEIVQSVMVKIIGDAEMQNLNLAYRSVDSSTDVLTFPSGKAEPFPMGDIAICANYAQRQAAFRNVSLDNEISALIIHGVLHLVGFDDETEEDQAVMQAEMHRTAELLELQIDAHWTSMPYEQPTGPELV